jgi:hypothetical protein
LTEGNFTGSRTKNTGYTTVNKIAKSVTRAAYADLIDKYPVMVTLRGLEFDSEATDVTHLPKT